MERGEEDRLWSGYSGSRIDESLLFIFALAKAEETRKWFFGGCIDADATADAKADDLCGTLIGSRSTRFVLFDLPPEFDL